MEYYKEEQYDVVVVGAGSAGISAAVAASKNGVKTLLVEKDSFIGGDLVSGLPIDGCRNSRGEWIVKGVAEEIFNECRRLNGYICSIFDWRSIYVVCINPEIMKIALINTLCANRVDLLLYTFIYKTELNEKNEIMNLIAHTTNGDIKISADFFVDCSGDGTLAVQSGIPYEKGGDNNSFQPVSLIFRVDNIKSEDLLEFIREHPENAILSDNPAITKSPKECAEELYRQGYPKVFLSAKGPVLKEAIDKGELYPCTGIASTPISNDRKEVAINTTRIANVDATKPDDLSQTLPELIRQVEICVKFLKNNIPGYADSFFSSIAPRIGIRETRRIAGEEILEEEFVLNGTKSEKGIAKGGHHIDIHGSGTYQRRQPVKNGGSYDIPYGCLIPKKTKNLLIAGRCISSSRSANGSARVMGTCMATGQAAGTAVALCKNNEYGDVRQLPLNTLRETLSQQGAVLEGTK
jgi:hypothetical protein